MNTLEIITTYMPQDYQKTYHTAPEAKKILANWLREDAKDLRKTLQTVKTANYECNV